MAEALAKAVKHSHASCLAVRLARDRGALMIEVSGRQQEVLGLQVSDDGRRRVLAVIRYLAR